MTTSTTELNQLQIAIVVSDYYPELSEMMLQDCIYSLETTKNCKIQLSTHHVPGSFELPWAAQSIIQQSPETVDAVICLGCFVQTEKLSQRTHHLTSTCFDALQSVSLHTGIPVICGVLTQASYEEAKHMIHEGHAKEMAKSAIQVAVLKRQFMNKV